MKTNCFKKLILTVLMVVVAGIASAQLTIPGTNITYRLNGEDWRYLRTFELAEGGDVYLYCYTGHVLVDMEGDTVLPFLRIYVNKDYDGDLYELAYERYEAQPFQSLKEYTKGEGLPSKGGIGYIGAYTNPTDQKDYQFYMTYFKDRGTSVEFRLETTKDTFEEMDFEFKDILSSIK
ncbi:MAG: hypothetical protein II849_03385 [Bacteroidales bacterium]|nr:hypothetical protein [Bacteroidales bacterium]